MSLIDAWKEIEARVYQTAVAHGWWNGGDRNQAELICLMHSELSEALEGYRHGNPKSDKIPEFSSMEEEFADVVIRMMDFAAHYGLDVAGAIEAKMKYNESRPFRHGNKVC